MTDFDCLAQQRRPLIGQMLGQRGVVTRRVLVEQPADIGLRHRRRSLASAQACELQPGAVVVVRVQSLGLFESGNRAARVAEPVADGAECEPRRSESGRQLDRLHEDIRGAGKIAAPRVVERPLIAPVGDEIAGRDEKRAGVGHRVLASLNEMII